MEVILLHYMQLQTWHGACVGCRCMAQSAKPYIQYAWIKHEPGIYHFIKSAIAGARHTGRPLTAILQLMWPRWQYILNYDANVRHSQCVIDKKNCKEYERMWAAILILALSSAAVDDETILHRATLAYFIYYSQRNTLHLHILMSNFPLTQNTFLSVGVDCCAHAPTCRHTITPIWIPWIQSLCEA